MSDSDDTDVLLLIPPDFFFVAPSPSPVSSPSTLSPPPIPKSAYKQERLLTEELARKSLKDITSKLKVLDRRLSLIEGQHSDSMDGDRSSNWFELDSNASGSARYRPHDTIEKASERISTDVQELIQASLRDPRSIMQRKGGTLTHSWGPSGRESQFHSTQRTRSSSGRRDGNLLARVIHQEKGGSSDEEGELDSRDRRSSSLPPTPSSYQFHKKMEDYSESVSCRPSSLYNRGTIQPAQNQEDATSRLSCELERNPRQMAAEEMRGKSSNMTSLTHENGRFARLDFGNEEEQSLSKNVGGKSSGKAESRSEWTEKRPCGEISSRWDHNQSLGAGGEESFNMNLSNLDGTLGVSAILPSLSSLGLGSSVMQGSLDMTKESGSTSGGGLGGGLSLSEVERLLEDMHQTQAEMEKSMRRGKAQLLSKSNEEQEIGSKGNRDIGESKLRADHSDGDYHGVVTDKEKISSTEKKDQSICQGHVREEIKRLEGWVSEGKNEGPMPESKSSSVKIIVDGAPKKSQTAAKSNDTQGNTIKESSGRGWTEGLSVKDGSLVHRSKSDESLTGGHGKTSRNKTRAKYLGVDSSDDSLISSGPIASTHISRLGDTLGSVPDLGLGVREMFANPQKYREPVKEPPFVKKNMSLLGSSYPTSSDAPRVMPQGDNNRETESYGKSPKDRNAFGHPQKGSRDSEKPVWHSTHFGGEGTGMGQSCGQGNDSSDVNPVANLSHAGVKEQQIPCITPQKYLYSPQSSVENRENSGRDARRQLQFNEMRHKEQELNSPPPGGNTLSYPPIRDGREDSVQAKGMEAEAAEGATDQEDHVIPKPMGPVMVVGGEGRYRKRRKAGENDGFVWVGNRDGRPMRGNRVRIGRGQGGHWWSKGVGMVREHRGASDEGRRKWTMRDGGHRSLDDYLGQARAGRFKESDVHSGGPQSFPWDPAGGGHQFLSESDMWVPPLAPGLTKAEEVITLRRKLEEERFRREHCERVIEEVGHRALEAQERLAVSQGLGKAKDVALGKFREAWEEAVSGWKREAEARKSLEEEVNRYRDRVDAEIAFRDQRQKQLEAELVRFGAESSSLREELRKGQCETADVTARLSGVLETATKEVTACRKESESASLREARALEAAAKAEEVAKDAGKKLNEANQRANAAESQKCMMNQELETLQGKFRDCMSRVATLEGHLADAEVAADHARQSEKKATEDRLTSQQELEKERVRLKEFYQSQVEELVKSKVTEFQGQLDAIELSLRKEAEVREECAKRQGEERLKLLSEKHAQEVSLLEQKHAEELAYCSHKLKGVVSKYHSHEAQLAKGLSVWMEAKLKEGLHLIASGGAGVNNESFLSPLKQPEKKPPTVDTSWRDVMASLNFRDTSDIVPEKDVIPKKDTDQDLGYSSMLKEKTIDKDKEILSIGSKSSVPNCDLRKYIHMLLDREPGKPLNLMDIGSDSDEDSENQPKQMKHRKQTETKEVRKPLQTAESEKMSVREYKALKKTRKENEALSKPPKDSQFRAMWEPMAFKLGEPCSTGQLFESDKCDLEGQRYRKPPWK